MHSANDDQDKQQPAPGADTSSRPSGDVGDALRRAYDETLKESVPDDLLDLLKKLD
ncbi:NepR family anti-sigma factor [Sphingomonas azotifigens]|uniref:NepR family anti-sigma factor n=1 Tax=Sphingomonas azotifigens TaxID=330920 RepID=UPI001FEB9ECA|nr:NepR family anti-sigma factor [Sphingomonas azotifigens]